MTYFGGYAILHGYVTNNRSMDINYFTEEDTHIRLVGGGDLSTTTRTYHLTVEKQGDPILMKIILDEMAEPKNFEKLLVVRWI